MTTRVEAKTQVLIRRAAAKLIGDYAPPALDYSQELLEELEAAMEGAPAGSEWAGFTAEIAHAIRLRGANY